MDVNYNGEEFLKRLKEISGLNQRELSEKLRINQTTISRWKETIPKTENLIEIAKTFNCSIDYLLGINNNSYYVQDNHIHNDIISLVKHIINFDLSGSSLFQTDIAAADFNDLLNIREGRPGIFFSCIDEERLNKLDDLFQEYLTLRPALMIFKQNGNMDFITNALDGLIKKYQLDLFDIPFTDTSLFSS